jgi:hypothetical protein
VKQELIDAILSHSMALVAQLATTGGGRVPLGHVADQVFLSLTEELQRQGLTKKVIADMLGMSLRTYHRRMHEVRERRELPRTTWEAVLELIRSVDAISGQAVQQRLLHCDVELISGALNDLTRTGLVLRSGWGDSAVYRLPAGSGSLEPESEIRVAG